MRIIYALHSDAADVFRLRHKAFRNPSGSYDSDPDNGMLLAPQHGGRHVSGSLQIHHLAVILEMVKGSHPVRADDKHVNLIFLNVLHLLAHVVLHNDLVRKPCPFYVFDPLIQGIYDIQLSPGLVVLLRGNADDQIIPELPGALQYIIMTLVKQIKGSVSNDLFHLSVPPPFRPGFSSSSKLILFSSTTSGL